MTSTTAEVPPLFGDGAERLGPAELPWAVYISGLEDVRPAATRGAALTQAAEINAQAFLAHRTNPQDPVIHAVVLRDGYAWSRAELPAIPDSISDMGAAADAE